MLSRIIYTDEDDGVSILRCLGDGPVIEVPDHIDDRPVLALADHCFAKEPSSRCRREVWKQAFFNGERWTKEPGGPAAASEGALRQAWDPEEIVLPASLRAIGDYAFYGCRSLRKIRFPAGSCSLGRGILVACHQVETLVFETEPGEWISPCMRDVLGEITYEVEIEAGGCCLYFPGYYEDSVENTPARIIDVVFEGTGFKYRQCFREGTLDFALYDSLFYTASVQELPETAARIAFDRLLYPVLLSDQAKEEYLSWLRARPEWLADWIFGDRQARGMEMLELLCREGFFDIGLLELFLEQASRRGRPEAVSLLMEQRRRLAPQRRRKYEF